MWALLLATLSAVTFSLFGPVPGNAGPAITLLLIWGATIWILPRPTGGPRAVFLAALAIRVILLAAEPELSDDIFRYIWEGRVVEFGGNPYQHAPREHPLPGTFRVRPAAPLGEPSRGAQHLPTNRPLPICLFRRDSA